ncbi:unnamed protein product [Alopecurus aequalis]
MSSSSQSSQSSESGQDGPVPISFNMHRGGMGVFHLEMPVDVEMSMSRNAYPLVLFELKDEDQVDCLMRMKQLQHENILGMHFYDAATVGNDIQAYVEPYTGFISDLFHRDYFVNTDTDLVPSPAFQQIVSSSLGALDYLIKNDSYHGNFSWNTTLYHQEKDGRKVLKLANFEKKSKSLLECQLGDCHALVQGLEEVSLYVRAEYVNYKPETCVLINDLALSLRDVTVVPLFLIYFSESLSMMKHNHENHAFFWNGKRKRSFYAYEIPAAWDKPAFLASFRNSRSMPAMPWDSSWKSNSLKDEMEIYRKDNGIREYNFHELNDFFRFISGLYTHQIELKEQMESKNKVYHDVDAVVSAKHPRLLLDLKAATEATDGMDLDDP